MRDARPLLLDPTSSPTVAEVAAGWKQRVDLVRGESQQAPADALLIRPDGDVAWALAPGESAEDVRCGLERALATWFG